MYNYFSPTEGNKQGVDNEDPVNSLDRSAEEKERLQALDDGESKEKGEEPGADSECASSTQRKMEKWERHLPSVSDGSMYLFQISSECVHTSLNSLTVVQTRLFYLLYIFGMPRYLSLNQ